jgi:hypothetical protein
VAESGNLAGLRAAKQISSFEPENRKAGILSNLQRIRQGIAGIYAASN